LKMRQAIKTEILNPGEKTLLEQFVPTEISKNNQLSP
jgi:hypothetical protein